MTQNPSKTDRGTLIVDANVLMSMGLPVGRELLDEHLLDEPQRHIPYFYEALPFLAKHGYKILIPEMVMFEVTSLLMNGKDIDGYFPHVTRIEKEKLGAHPYVAHKYEDKFGDERKILKNFMREVMRGKYPGISIVPSNAPDEVRAYLARLNDASEQFEHPCKEANIAIRKIQEETKKDFGDNAIMELLKDTLLHKPTVLTNDLEAASLLACAYRHVGLCNTSGLWDALCDTTLQKELGIKGGITTGIIKRYYDEQASISNYAHNIGGLHIDCRGADYHRYHAGYRNPMSQETFKDFLHTKHPRPFSIAMFKMRNEEKLGDARADRPEAMHIPVPEENPIAKFQKRFSHWHSKQSGTGKTPG